jgi:uncharacterized membrane protein
VAGDAVDLASLGAAFGAREARPGRLAAATAAVAGVTLVDVACGMQLGRRDRAARAGAGTTAGSRVRQRIAINRAPEEVYRFWRDVENHPRFMRRVERVERTGEHRSHWVATAPGGMRVEWDAEMVDDRPNALIAWRSLTPAPLWTSGSVRFERGPHGRGTIVRLEMDVRPAGGAIAAALASLLGRAHGMQAREDLRRLKQLLEAGEIPTTEGQTSGRAAAGGPGGARTAEPSRRLATGG